MLIGVQIFPFSSKELGWIDHFYDILVLTINKTYLNSSIHTPLFNRG